MRSYLEIQLFLSVHLDRSIPLWIAILCPPVQAQGLLLSSQLAAAVNDASEAFQKLEIGRQAATDALLGKRVNTGSGRAIIAAKYDKAAKEARQSPLPSEFQSKNIASVQEFASCSTRSTTLVKLKAYLDELKNSRSTGLRAVTALNERLQEVPKARKAVEYLKSVHEKLVSLPVYGEKFALDWIGLDGLQLFLSGLESDFRAQKKRFTEDSSKMDVSIRNYTTNLAQLQNLKYPQR